MELRDAGRNPPGASAAEVQHRTLTNLYNARPAWLADAHAVLGRAVLDAYGWPHDLTDDDLLARLLALNAERGGRRRLRTPSAVTAASAVGAGRSLSFAVEGHGGQRRRAGSGQGWRSPEPARSGRSIDVPFTFVNLRFFCT